MTNKKLYRGICCLFCLLFFSCISSTLEHIAPMTANLKVLDSQARAQDYFITGRDYERRGLQQMAEQFYKLAYSFDPNQTLRDYLIDFYLSSSKLQEAVTVLKGDKKVADLSDTEKRFAAQLYVQLRQFNNAKEAIMKLSVPTVSDRIQLASLYEQEENYSKAIELYRDSFEENPASFRNGLKLAELFIKEKKYSDAEDVYEHMDSVYTEYKIELLNRLGIIQLLKNDSSKAMQYFIKALNLDSLNMETILNVAQMYISQNDFNQAIRFYEKLPQENILSAFYHQRTLALLYYYNKEYTKAELLLQQLLSVNIENFELHYYMGLVQIAQKNYALAEAELWKCLVIKDDYTEAWVQLCYLALKQEDNRQALDYALQFKNKLPDQISSWKMYGYVLVINKRYPEAIESYKKALNMDSKDISVLFDLGSAYERAGNFSKAEDAFKAVLRLQPSNAGALNYLGYMWAEHSNNLNEAKKMLEKALLLEPENGAYLDSYGWILYKLGDYKAALSYILKAIETIADDPVIYDHLGDIYVKMNSFQFAKDAYKKSILLGADNKEHILKKIKQLDSTKKINE